MYKLKTLKWALKDCRRKSFDTPVSNIKRIKTQLKEVHDNLGIDPLNFDLHKVELDLQNELRHWLVNEESQTRQKSRKFWIHQCDKNTKNFYSIVKAK